MRASETRASEGSPEFTVVPPPGGSLLRERNFRLFFSGQLVSNSGTFLQSVAQGVLVQHLTHRAFMVGVTTAAVFLPVLLLSLTGGSLADRLDRRRLLIATQILAMVATGTLAVLAAAGHASVPAGIPGASPARGAVAGGHPAAPGPPPGVPGAPRLVAANGADPG